MAIVGTMGSHQENRSVTSGETDDPKITAFYDGKCPMCTALMGRVGHSEKGGLL